LLLNETEEYETEERLEGNYPFWVTTTTSGFRRLHRTGGCNTPKAGIACWTYATLEEIKANKADKPCLRCWPELKNAEESDSSESEESSSSGTEPGDFDTGGVEVVGD
jgi:hypothetical protein